VHAHACIQNLLNEQKYRFVITCVWQLLRWD